MTVFFMAVIPVTFSENDIFARNQNFLDGLYRRDGGKASGGESPQIGDTSYPFPDVNRWG
jgi:hypothetical protein